MLQDFIRKLFGPFSSGKISALTNFVKLLQESYAYLREHRYRVLSTELPDDLLQKWLLPAPGDGGVAAYLRKFADKSDTLSPVYLPIFVFDYVLQKRYGQDIVTFDEAEMDVAAGDLRSYILLLNYIFRMRAEGQTPLEFDLFDLENYDTILRRIEVSEPGALSGR